MTPHLADARLASREAWTEEERAHAAGCPRCAREARLWEELAPELPAAPEPDPDDVRALAGGLPLELVGLIDRGGMGEVWRARDPDLDREVALKRIRRDHAPDPERIAAFEREARVTARLQHPGVVPIYARGTDAAGRPWYTMREVGGRTLHDEIRAHRPDDAALRRLVDAFARICETMAFVHSAGVVHRDLKPANVRLGEFGDVVVLDWGLAHVLGDPQPPGSWRVGTPGYVAPEVLGPSPPAWPLRTDVFALGAILDEILRGGGPDRPEGAPADLVEIVARATVEDPDLRLPDAAALATLVRAWLDGARRRLRAGELVAEADALAADVTRLRAEAAALRAEGRRRLEAVARWEPADRKESAWALEDEAERLEIEAQTVELTWTELLRSALVEAPDHPGALDRLADHYAREHAEAEAAGDRRRSAAAEARLRLHDRGRYAGWLRGMGALSVVTDPPGAVTLYRFELRGRRLVEVFEARLGHTPIARHPVRAGSYKLRIRAPGRAEVSVCVQVGRGEHADLVRPGDRDPFPLPLPLVSALGPDDVYVPAGWCRLGGDPDANFGHPARRVWVDGFVVRRFPVTNRELVAFLDALVAEGREEEALRHAPRLPTALAVAPPIFARDAEGRFHPAPDADGDTWQLDWPALLVDLETCRAVAAREAERTGQPWRLPFEVEWEKAGRGADGRRYPWGDHFDESWACTSHSHPPGRKKLPAPVTAWPADESPYGVRGLAGNVRDRCLDRFADPPPRSGEVAPRVAREGPGSRVIKGGSWGAEMQTARLASRGGLDPEVRGQQVGFRLVRPWP